MKHLKFLTLAILALFASCSESEVIPEQTANPELTTQLMGNITEVYLDDLLGNWTVVDAYKTDKNRHNKEQITDFDGAALSVSEVYSSRDGKEAASIRFNGMEYQALTIKMNKSFFNRIAFVNGSYINELNQRNIIEENPVHSYSGMYFDNEKLHILSIQTNGEYQTLVFDR